MAAESTQLSVIISLQDELSGKMGNINSSLSKMGSAGSNLKSTFAGIGQRFSTEFSLIEKAAKAAAVGIAVVGGALIAAGISAVKSASSYEQNRIAFETMLGSAEKARKLLKEISIFAKETPFELPDVVTGSQRLLAFGIAQEKIIPTFRILGDIAMGNGEKMDSMIRMFGKAKSKGVVDLEALNIAIDAGVPIIANLSRHFKVSEAAIFEMVSKGKVKFAELEATMTEMTSKGGLFYNGMIMQSTTLGGLTSNLQDSIGAFAREVIGINDQGDIREGSIFYNLKKGASKLYTFLEENKEVITTTVVNALNRAIESVKKWIAQMGGVDGIKQKMIAFKDKIVNEVIPAIIKIGSKITELTAWMWEHREAIVVAIIAWEAFKVALSIGQIISALSATFTAVSAAITAAGGAAGIFAAIMAVITAPVTIWIAAIAAVIAIGYLIWKNWDFLSQKAVEIWGAISSFLMTTWTNITTWIIEKVTAIWTGIVSIWTSIVEYIQTKLLQDIGFALGLIVGTIIMLPIHIANGIGALGVFMWTKIFVPAWKYLTDNFPRWIDAMLQFFKDLPGNVVKSVADLGSFIWTRIMLPAGKYLTTNFPKWIDGILQFFKDLPQNIFNALGSLGQKIGDAFKNAFNWVKNNWSSFTKGFGEGFQKALDLAGLKFAAGGVVQGFMNGGMVYASNGFFQPRGTDTVPAMLTPGEMVLNAGQQSNLFSQLNGGKGRSISINITGDNYFSTEADEDRLIDKMRQVLSREQERANWGIS